jgi:hypothetical protein
MSTSTDDISGSASIGSSTSGQVPTSFSQRGSPQESLLNLRIVRGPLKPHENESIISQYNNLAFAAIPIEDYLRWVQGSPEGPAWHAILETQDGDIVGHTSLIPFRATYAGQCFVAAKSEYSFIREEFRASKILGFEKTGKLKNLIYIDELFRQCRLEGWSPLLISTPSGFHRVFRSIACYPVEFPLWECLLVLRPRQAGWKTPNLRRWQRVSLWGVGLAQSAFWGPASLFLSGRPKGLSTLRPDESPMYHPDSSLSFFQDRGSLTWRYPEDQYERITGKANGDSELVIKCGSANRYLRVCQWNLNSQPPTSALIAKLVQKAWQQQALGVRWAVYGEDAASAELVRRLRNFGFLCARRVRTLLVNTASQEFLDPKAWNLTDSMFSFDQ